MNSRPSRGYWTINRENSTASDRAFSLVELMIAIVIITTLVGFIVPNVVDYFRQSRVTVLQYQLRTMRSAIAKYARDHHGAYPRALQRLVDEGYLAELPEDPFATGGDTWEVIVGSAEISLGLYGKRFPQFITFNDGGTITPYGPYHIVPRMTSPPYYDPVTGDPAVTAGAVEFLYWSNMGVINVRSGASVFEGASVGLRTSSYYNIDSWETIPTELQIAPANDTASPPSYSNADFDN